MTPSQKQAIEAKAEELYPLEKYRASTITLRKNFIEAAAFGLSLNGWVRAEDKPLFIIDNNGNWECTTNGEGQFIGAAQIKDIRTNKVSWWVHHCVVEDRIGLCVVDEDDNQPAGIGIEDIEYYMPLPTLPNI